MALQVCSALHCAQLSPKRHDPEEENSHLQAPHKTPCQAQLLRSCDSGAWAPGSHLQVMLCLRRHIFRAPDQVTPATFLVCAVWAPTTQTMELLHFKAARNGEPKVLPMARDVLGPGVWSADLPKGESWWTYYKFRWGSVLTCATGLCMCACQFVHSCVSSMAAHVEPVHV